MYCTVQSLDLYAELPVTRIEFAFPTSVPWSLQQ